MHYAETLLDGKIKLKHPEYYGIERCEDSYHINTLNQMGWQDPLPGLLKDQILNSDLSSSSSDGSFASEDDPLDKGKKPEIFDAQGEYIPPKDILWQQAQ